MPWVGQMAKSLPSAPYSIRGRARQRERALQQHRRNSIRAWEARFNRSSATIASPTASRFKPDYSFANGCLCEKVVTNVIITCFLRGYQF